MTRFAEKANKAEKGSTAQYTVQKKCGISAKKVLQNPSAKIFFSTSFALCFAAKPLCDGFFRLIRFFSMKIDG